jgi:glycosyltransferase involved in cell wall biosynthesis
VSAAQQARVRAAFFLSDLDAGGAQRTVANLVNGLPPDRVAARLIVARNTGSARDWLAQADNVVDLGCVRTRDALWPLRRYLGAEHPNVLFATMVDANIIAALATRLSAQAPRLILRETNSHRSRDDLGRVRRCAVRWAYRRADAVVALSHGVGRELIADYGLDPARVVTIHNPVDIESWRLRAQAVRRAAAPWGPFGGDGPVLVAVGRLIRQKGFDLLLRALARCAGAGQKAQLVIVGEGPERGALEALAQELGVAGRVLLAGFVADPAAWYAHGDIFVLPSRWEGFGHVIVEAMACGLPVIAFDCPYGPVDILGKGKGGILVAPEDESALAAAIDSVLGDPEQRARLTAAAPGVAGRFSQQRIVMEYAHLIEAVAGNTPICPT